MPFRIENALCERAAAVCRAEGKSLFDLLLAALFALCHRYSGQEDLVLGAAAEQPEHPWHGDLAHVLALRVPVSGGLLFHELVDRVAAAYAEARGQGEPDLATRADASYLPTLPRTGSRFTLSQRIRVPSAPDPTRCVLCAALGRLREGSSSEALLSP